MMQAAGISDPTRAHGHMGARKSETNKQKKVIAAEIGGCVSGVYREFEIRRNVVRGSS